MLQEVAIILRIARRMSWGAAAFIGVGLLLMFVRFSTSQFVDYDIVVSGVLLIALGLSVSAATFCNDIVKGMRKKKMI